MPATLAYAKTPGQGIAVPYMTEGFEIQFNHANEGTDSPMTVLPAAPETKAFQSAKENCSKFNDEMSTYINISGSAPNPWLANRPEWSNPDFDILDEPGSDVCQPDHAEWRSPAIRIPHTLRYAKCDESENWTTASIYMNVSQKVGDRDPVINFEQHGWDTKGKPIGDDTPHRKYTLTANEAAYLARGLLLLVDLALGTSDDIGTDSRNAA